MVWTSVEQNAKAPLTKILRYLVHDHLARLCSERKLGPEATTELRALCCALASCGAPPRGSGQARGTQRSGQLPARGLEPPAGGRCEGASRFKEPIKDSSKRGPIAMEEFLAQLLNAQPEVASTSKTGLVKQGSRSGLAPSVVVHIARPATSTGVATGQGLLP